MAKKKERKTTASYPSGWQASILLQAAHSLYQKSGLMARPSSFSKCGDSKLFKICHYFACDI
jgi:hypothetical protein